jgi:hypothetical protein
MAWTAGTRGDYVRAESEVGFQRLSPLKVAFGIRSRRGEKCLMKPMPRSSPPNHPKSTGPENIGRERTDFGSLGIGAVGSLAGTTL